MFGAHCWLLAVGCWLLAVGCWLLAVGCWLLAVGCWLLAIGYWLLWTAQAMAPACASAVSIFGQRYQSPSLQIGFIARFNDAAARGRWPKCCQ
ncbi:hypothetical protein CVS41_14105 [Aeromonas veronii]|nr:hypothetical protein CVS41_14105 [Aeromonas veronii]